MEQDKKQKPELEEEQLKEVGGGDLPESAKVPESSNSVEADGKCQLNDENLAGVDGGIIPPLPIDPTTSTL